MFISHKLGEVLEVADRITVLRRGKKVDTVPRQGATELTLARLVVGRDVMLRVDKTQAKPEGPLLDVRDLYVTTASSRRSPGSRCRCARVRSSRCWRRRERPAGAR